VENNEGKALFSEVKPPFAARDMTIALNTESVMLDIVSPVVK